MNELMSIVVLTATIVGIIYLSDVVFDWYDIYIEDHVICPKCCKKITWSDPRSPYHSVPVCGCSFK